jgi:hypothetical protein
VDVQVAARREFLVALATLEGLFSRVEAKVDFEGATVCECPVALGTFEGLLSRVNPEVSSQVSAFRKGFRTSRALKGLHLGVKFTEVCGPISYRC